MDNLREEQPHVHREIPETTRIKPVIDRLRSIIYEQVYGFMEKKKEDAKAGIGIVNLTELGLVEAVEVNNLCYQFYIAFVPPTGHVKSHYHEHGEEPYRFMFPDTGGEMNLGDVHKGKVEWDPESPMQISQDDEVEIPERKVHSYHNTAPKPVFFLFACPAEHLIDFDQEKAPHGDRYIVEGKLEDGVPPHYSKS